MCAQICNFDLGISCIEPSNSLVDNSVRLWSSKSSPGNLLEDSYFFLICRSLICLSALENALGGKCSWHGALKLNSQTWFMSQLPSVGIQQYIDRQSSLALWVSHGVWDHTLTIVSFWSYDSLLFMNIHPLWWYICPFGVNCFQNQMWIFWFNFAQLEFLLQQSTSSCSYCQPCKKYSLHLM